jgi:transposase-like protein
MSQSNKYSPEFKAGLVAAIVAGEKPLCVQERTGVCQVTLRMWLKAAGYTAQRRQTWVKL